MHSWFARAFRELAEKLSTVLVAFNKSLNMGEVLEDSKKANVVPVI